MVISFAHLSPLLSILFGILILIFPRLLNYLVAIYLILAGLLGIGLIGRPLRAHADLSQPATASAIDACRPAADVGVSAVPEPERPGPRLAPKPGLARRPARRLAPIASTALRSGLEGSRAARTGAPLSTRVSG